MLVIFDTIKSAKKARKSINYLIFQNFITFILAIIHSKTLTGFLLRGTIALLENGNIRADPLQSKLATTCALMKLISS